MDAMHPAPKPHTDKTWKPTTLEAPPSPPSLDSPPSSFSFLKQSSRPSTIVIGAGLGGLSTGIHLARQGWKVTILEKNAQCGGRMNQIREQGFRIDMGPTMLMMPDVLEGIFRSCGRDPKDYLTLKRISPAYSVRWSDGAKLDMGGSLAELQASARAFSPEDAQRLPALFAKMQDKYENARHNFIEQPFNDLASMTRPSTLRGLVRSLPYESVYKMVSRIIRNERLRQAFTFQTLYLGISPKQCPSIYALLPYIEMEFGVWFPEGGAYALAEALERLFLELGGEVRYNVPVERILTEGRTAKGVRLCSGETIFADAIACNLDAPTAYRHLLPPELCKKNSSAYYAKKEFGASGYLLYLGVRHIPSDLGHNVILLSDNYDQVLEDVCITKRVPRDPAMHVCIPTRTDPTLAPAGHDVVYVLVPTPNAHTSIDWKTEAPLLREKALEKLERAGMPRLRENIVFERSLTPPDFESLYGCHAGAAYSGLTPTFLQSAYFRPHNRSEDFESLYFVGASVHPGGGVPIVLTSGRLTADEIVANAHKR